MPHAKAISITGTPSSEQTRRVARARLVEGLLCVSAPDLSKGEVLAALERLVAGLRADLEALAHVEGANNE